MFLDCLSLLQWEVFRFCNVFKVVASCSISFFFFFQAIFEQPQASTEH